MAATYLMITMTIVPKDGFDVEKLKDLIESNSTNLPGNGCLITQEDDVLAEVYKLRVSTWPKDLGDGDS